MNDIFHVFSDRSVEWVGSISDPRFSAVVRLFILFAVPAVIYYWGFVNQFREGSWRCIAAIIIDALVLAIPIPAPEMESARAWILILCVVGLVFLPGFIPFLIYREAGKQQRLRVALYVLMATLFLVGIVWS